MNIVLLIIVFFLALDMLGFTKIISRPLVACTCIGAALGKLETGIMIGGSLELYYITYESQTSAQGLSNGFFFASIIATILAVVANMDSANALSSALGCVVVGMVISYVLSLINTLFLPMARSAAEKRCEKKLTVSLFVPYVLNALIYTLIAFVTYTYGEGIVTTITSLTSYWWIMATFSYISLLMPCIAFAILLRNIGLKDVTGALLGGVGVAIMISLVSYTGFASVLVAILAFAIACLDFHLYKKEEVKTQPKQTTLKNTIKGGNEKWW